MNNITTTSVYLNKTTLSLTSFEQWRDPDVHVLVVGGAVLKMVHDFQEAKRLLAREVVKLAKS